MSLVIGADPEYLVRDNRTGAFVSAHNLIPGSKKKPHKYKSGAIQVDGVSAEININPATSSAMFINNINQIREYLTNRLGPTYSIAATPFAEFDQSYFDQLPEAAKELGCDPDFNAWSNGAENPAPLAAGPFRTGAGHVHLGWCKPDKALMRDPDHRNDCVAMVKQLDYYIGIHTLRYDPDGRRRSLYGRAGAFRIKPYGVEYRVPSNSWLRDEVLMSWIFRAAQAAYFDLKAGVSPVVEYGDLAAEIINGNQTDWTDWAPPALVNTKSVLMPKLEDFNVAA